MEKAIKLIIICFGLAVISFFPVVTPAESQNASLPFTLDEIQNICQSRNSTEVPSLNCEYINRCVNYGSLISKCYADSKEAPPIIEDENDTLYEEDEDDILNENKTPVMTPERATYIMLVCTGRILIEDLSVDGYCSGIQLCLSYKSMAECYTDLKNGEIENWSISGYPP
jgi:hypothetical protein